LWEAKLVCSHYHSGNPLTNVALGREFEDENISPFHMEPRFTSWSGAMTPSDKTLPSWGRGRGAIHETLIHIHVSADLNSLVLMQLQRL